MEVYITIAILLIALLVLIYFRVFRKGKSEIDLSKKVLQLTAGGIAIYSESGVSVRFRQIADASLNQLFQDARERGYLQQIRHFDYTIYVLDTCTIRNGTPCFLVEADDYDGTEFDQDPRPGKGKVFAAEQVISLNPCEFIVCNSDDEAYIANAVRYGAEHCILFHNDKAEYERTKTHSNGEGHPIIK